ncbi:Cys-tRNA(Pro) deacylase [Streptomyces abikoensis]|uniref:Cys-tRNA(Pro)/Cys-tRNA(Cys) deacylase n=1 Tax=Streptomyces abikoensis TaxID=97398 RepID=A0ABW7T0Y1_9ACTN
MAKKNGKRQGAGSTPAIVALEKAGAAFTVHAYEHDPATPSYGEEAAQALGVEPGRVFKTLVAEVDGALTVAVVPVSGSLDLKALATAVGGKRATMADPAAAERTTGYVRGGISPLGQRKRLPTALDASARAHTTICVSAGRRGLEVELAPEDLAGLTGAVVAAIARP